MFFGEDLFKSVFNKINEIIHNPIVRQYFSNSFWMFLSRIFWIIGALTVGVLVARTLGPHDFGVLNYCIAYVEVFSVISNLGIDDLVCRNVVMHPDEHNKIVANYVLFKVFAVIFMLVVLLISFPFFTDKETAYYCSIIALGYIFYPLGAVSVYLTAFVKNQYRAFADFISCSVYNLFRLIICLTSASFVWYVSSQALLISISAIMVFVYYCFKGSSPLKWSFSIKGVLGLIKPALLLSFAMVLNIIYMRTDVLMLKYFQNVTEIGYYSIATRFTFNWNLLISMTFSGIFAVAVVSAFKTSVSEYKKQLHRFYFSLFWITIPIIALSCLCAEIVIKFLYGVEFLPATKIFYIFIFSVIPTSVFAGLNCHLINENRLKTLCFVSITGVILNIIFNLYTIPNFAGCGAAFSSVISFPLGMALTLLCTRKGRVDLKFILYSIFHLPSLEFNKPLKK